jgi:hypothetical protein
MADSIPFMGSFVQGFLIIAVAPFLINLFKKYADVRRSKDNIVNFNKDVRIDGDGSLQISQIKYVAYPFFRCGTINQKLIYQSKFSICLFTFVSPYTNRQPYHLETTVIRLNSLCN